MAAILVPTMFSSGEMREIEEAIRRKFGSEGERKHPGDR
jgi:hypothetical protein